jgi:hypothetical protein
MIGGYHEGGFPRRLRRAAPHSHLEDYAYNVPGASRDGIEFGRANASSMLRSGLPDRPSRSLRLGKDGKILSELRRRCGVGRIRLVPRCVLRLRGSLERTPEGLEVFP